METSVKAVASKPTEPIKATSQGRTLISDPESKKAVERLACRVTQSVDKKTSKGIPYMILECFTDKGNIDVFVWDKKIQSELGDVKNRPCIFHIERKPKGISLLRIEEIDRVKYGEDSKPILAVDSYVTNFDQDIPF